MLGKLSPEEINAVLRENSVGRIGCRDGDTIYVVPVTYAFDGECIIAHSREGLKINLMRKNPAVCFEVDTMQNLSNWKSVILQGEYEELHSEPDRHAAMHFFVSAIMHIEIGETARVPGLGDKSLRPSRPGEEQFVIYRIRIKEKTGRFEKN